MTTISEGCVWGSAIQVRVATMKIPPQALPPRAESPGLPGRVRQPAARPGRRPDIRVIGAGADATSGAYASSRRGLGRVGGFGRTTRLRPAVTGRL